MAPTDADIAQEIAAIRSTVSWRTSHIAGRLIIRAMRITAGGIIAACGAWLGATCIGLLATPFAAQSLLGLIAGVALGWLTLLVFAGAWITAFGPAPTSAEEDEQLRARAAAAAQQHYADAARASGAPDRMAWSYRAGRAMARVLGHW